MDDATAGPAPSSGTTPFAHHGRSEHREHSRDHPRPLRRHSSHASSCLLPLDEPPMLISPSTAEVCPPPSRPSLLASSPPGPAPPPPSTSSFLLFLVLVLLLLLPLVSCGIDGPPPTAPRGAGSGASRRGEDDDATPSPSSLASLSPHALPAKLTLVGVVAAAAVGAATLQRLVCEDASPPSVQGKAVAS